MGLSFVYQAFAVHASCFPHPNLPTCHSVPLNSIMQCTQIKVHDTTVYLHTAADNALQFCSDYTCQAACATIEDNWQVATDKCTLYNELELTYSVIESGGVVTMHNKECIAYNLGIPPQHTFLWTTVFSGSDELFAWSPTVVVVVLVLMLLLGVATTYAEGAHSKVLKRYDHIRDRPGGFGLLCDRVGLFRKKKKKNR
jgi:hypothetical protein